MSIEDAKLKVQMALADIQVKKAFNPNQPRAPKGQPNGGQFVQHGGGGWGTTWSNWLNGEAPKYPGAIDHPEPDSNGLKVQINKPNQPTANETWFDGSKTATATPKSPLPAHAGGKHPFAEWKDAPNSAAGWQNVEGQKPFLEQQLGPVDLPLNRPQNYHVGAGVVVLEDDGRVWVVHPTNQYGGYKATFPKGTQEADIPSLQANAIKEAYEESGLKVEIIDYLGDFERTTSTARFYVARRVGGDPSKMGWESQAVSLMPMADLRKQLNISKVDGPILDTFEDWLKYVHNPVHDKNYDIKKAKPFDEGKHKRWPKGTPLGGQFMPQDSVSGLTQPPKLGWKKDGSGVGANSVYWNKVLSVFQAAKAGNIQEIQSMIEDTQQKYNAWTWGDKTSSHIKWNAQVNQYAKQMLGEMQGKQGADAKAEALLGPAKISEWQKVGGKPGGSNPGGVYVDKDGTKWLVKGANNPSDDRAHSEALAAKLLGLTGAPAPDVKVVDLGGEYGGGLGVAVKWMDGLSPVGLEKGSAAFEKALDQYGPQVWIGNYDCVGLAADNMAQLPDGTAICPDVGGSLFYRAQGAKKAFEKDCPEIVSMKLKGYVAGATAPQLFSQSTSTQDIASFAKVGAISDKQIEDVVNASGIKNKSEMIDILKARRDKMTEVAANWKNSKAVLEKAPAEMPSETIAKPVTAVSFDENFMKPLIDKAKLEKPSDLVFSGFGAMAAATKGGDLGSAYDYALNEIKDHAFEKESQKPLWEKIADLAYNYKSAGFEGMDQEVVMNDSGLSSHIKDLIKANFNAVEGGGKKGENVADYAYLLGATDMNPTIIEKGNKIFDAINSEELDQAWGEAAIYAVNNTKGKDASKWAKALADAKTYQAKKIGETMTEQPPAAMFEKDVKSTIGDGLVSADQLSTYLDEFLPLNGMTLTMEMGDANLIDKLHAIANHSYKQAANPVINDYLTTVSKLTSISDYEKSKWKYLGDTILNSHKISYNSKGKWSDSLTDSEKNLFMGRAGGKKPQAKTESPIATYLASSPLAALKDDKEIQKAFIGIMNAKSADDAFSKYGAAKQVFSKHSQINDDGNKLLAAGQMALSVAAEKQHILSKGEGWPDAKPEITALFNSVGPKVETTAKAAAKAQSSVAAPAWGKYFLDANNTNAASNNPKVEKIKALFEANDEKGLLALNYGTNTYGKKQAQLANDALAAMGSDYKVSPGQKLNSHPGLVDDGIKVGTPIEPKLKAPKTEKEPAKKKITITKADLPDKPDFMNYHGKGKPLSSSEFVNKQNVMLADAVEKMGLDGDVTALENYKFQPINKTTGEPMGKPISLGVAASSHIQNYYAAVYASVNDKLNPPRPLEQFNVAKAKDLKELADIMPTVPLGTKYDMLKGNHKMGYYAALGVSSNPKLLEQGPIIDINKTPTLIEALKSTYSKAGAVTKSVIKSIQAGSSGAIVWAYRQGLKSYNNAPLDKITKHLIDDAHDLPAGALLTRHFAMSKAQQKQMAGAMPGLIFQSSGPESFSKDATATSGFGSGSWSESGVHSEAKYNKLIVTAGKSGMKVLPSFASGSFSGEEEISTLPGQRYMLLKPPVKNSKGGYDFHVVALPITEAAAVLHQSDNAPDLKLNPKPKKKAA